MNAIPNAEAALTRLLEAVDDGKLRQVLRLLEASGRRCSLEPALAAMRPRLRQLRPQRPLTLPRLLTVPFEAALERGPDEDWPFMISRARLADWHRLMIEGLDPATRAAALAAIEGRACDDHVAIMAAGHLVWPKAARLLAAASPSSDTAADEPAAAAETAAAEPAAAAETADQETADQETARRRAADLLAVGVELVALLGRLPSRLDAPDPDDQASLKAILALAEAGPADRLGLVAMVLLRTALRPAMLAEQLQELAAPSAGPRLRPLLDRLLRCHRACLERQVTEVATAPERPLEEVAEALCRLADALVGPEGQGAREAAADPETMALRQRAATVAHERYAAAITDLTVPLAETVETARAATVKAREAEARRLARLGRAARRLAPQTPIQRLTETALRHLLDPGPERGGEPRPPIGIDDARLVEILAGPDIAWQLLRPTATRR